MKTWIQILALSLLVSILTYAWASSSARSKATKEQDALIAKWEAERTRMESELDAARRKPAKVETKIETREVRVPVKVQATPEELMADLVDLKPQSRATRYQDLRRILFFLESLARQGNTSLPAIGGFLARNEDIDYERTMEEEIQRMERAAAVQESGQSTDDRNRFLSLSRGMRGVSRTDPLYPRSLRIGLLEVIADIGTPEAIRMLETVLQSTGRGYEVHWLARHLEVLAPGVYRDMLLAAAHDLIQHPFEIPNPSRMDSESMAYLYDVLALLNDTSFAPVAQSKLITVDGHLDPFALRYLNQTLKEQAVPSMLLALRDPRLQNSISKATLMNEVLDYAGQHPQSDQYFLEILTQGKDNTREQFMAVSRLDNGNLNAQIVQNRIQLLNSVEYGDPKLKSLVDRTLQNLEKRAKAIETKLQSQVGGQGAAVPVPIDPFGR